MALDIEPGDPFIFMKVGVHASEPLEAIIQRKREEIAKAGVSFWGYGGGTCHPLTAVQPFVKEYVANGVNVRLLMQEINSRHYAQPVRAEEYSADGVHWEKIHKDIHVLGSRYALVIESLDMVEMTIALEDSAVGVGRMRGAKGDKYIQGHVDKACLVFQPGGAPEPTGKQVALKLAARLHAPYAVLLKQN
ncbi:hypothetical protein [Ramlibacter sp.]|uniref:hypothetical protein n=1 Tax=Ramlibacter sp. TaxID=1917967 RepID=UPI003D0B0195